MHLRKLAWAVPLVLAAISVRAETAGSFLEGAKLASLTRPDTAAAAQSPMPAQAAGAHGGVAGRTAGTPSTSSGVVAEEVADDASSSRSTFEIRNFLTLVVALALVGWIQRRRRDA